MLDDEFLVIANVSQGAQAGDLHELVAGVNRSHVPDHLAVVHAYRLLALAEVRFVQGPTAQAEEEDIEESGRGDHVRMPVRAGRGGIEVHGIGLASGQRILADLLARNLVYLWGAMGPADERAIQRHDLPPPVGVGR